MSLSSDGLFIFDHGDLKGEIMRIENWCGYDIRFVEHKGEWWAVLDDICAVVNMHEQWVIRDLNENQFTRVRIDVNDTSEWKLIINEVGIYELLLTSNMLDGRKFRNWTSNVLKKLRASVGLQGYEVMRMMEESTQEKIDHFLDTLYFDEETGLIMQSVTVAGGDVEQIPFVV